MEVGSRLAEEGQKGAAEGFPEPPLVVRKSVRMSSSSRRSSSHLDLQKCIANEAMGVLNQTHDEMISHKDIQVARVLFRLNRREGRCGQRLHRSGCISDLPL